MSKILSDLVDEMEDREVDRRRHFWQPRDGTEEDIPFVSANLTLGGFYLLVALVLCWGCLVAMGLMGWQRPMPVRPGVLAVAALAPFIGFLLSRSQSALLSFFGFNFVVAGVALLGAAGLTALTPDAWPLVAPSLRIATVALALLGVLGLLLSGVFQWFVGAATAGCAVLGAALGLEMLVPFWGNLQPEVYVVAGVAVAFVAYQFWKHSDAHPTADNAVDTATAFYMAIILFVLAVVTSGRSDD